MPSVEADQKSLGVDGNPHAVSETRKSLCVATGFDRVAAMNDNRITELSVTCSHCGSANTLNTDLSFKNLVVRCSTCRTPLGRWFELRADEDERRANLE